MLQASLLLAMGAFTIGGFSSYRAGAPGVITCNGAGCHQNPVTGYHWGIGGLPVDGFRPNTVYNLTLVMSQPNGNAIEFSQKAAGFTLRSAGGTILTNPAGTALANSAEIYSTVPKAFTSGTAQWSFTWQSPANSGVTFYFAGCFVNNNGILDDTDEYQNDAQNFHAYSAPAGVENAQGVYNLALYPNPTRSTLTIPCKWADVTDAYAITTIGVREHIVLRALSADRCEADVSHLRVGLYQLCIATKDKKLKGSFVKE